MSTLRLATIRAVLRAHRGLLAAQAARVEKEDAFFRSQSQTGAAQAACAEMQRAGVEVDRARHTELGVLRAFAQEVLQGYGLELDTDPEDIVKLLSATKGLVRKGAA